MFVKPKINMGLNYAKMYVWSKFGDSSLNGWRVIARTNSWLTHRQTDRQTDTHTQTQATTIPEGQNWPRVKSLPSDRTNVAQFQLCRQKGIRNAVQIYDKTAPGICSVNMVPPHMETSRGDWKNPTSGHQKSSRAARPPLWRTTKGPEITHSRIQKTKGGSRQCIQIHEQSLRC